MLVFVFGSSWFQVQAASCDFGLGLASWHPNLKSGIRAALVIFPKVRGETWRIGNVLSGASAGERRSRTKRDIEQKQLGT